MEIVVPKQVMLGCLGKQDEQAMGIVSVLPQTLIQHLSPGSCF